jgi:hypothetical protein
VYIVANLFYSPTSELWNEMHEYITSEKYS